MRAWVGVLALCAVGCGTSSGNPIDGDDSDKPMDERSNTGGKANADEQYGCERHPEPVDDPATLTPLGFSADDILAFAGGTHQTTIRWQPSELVSYGPESGEHALTMTVRYAGGEVRYLSYTEKTGAGDERATPNIAIDRAFVCEQLNAVEFDVEVEVTSDGGALAERGKGTLYASNRNWAELRMPLDASALMGDFAITETRPAGGELVQAGLSAGISPLGLRGRFDGILQYRTGDSVGAAASRGPLAYIGDASTCSDGGLPVDLDQPIGGLTAQAGLDAVAAIRTARGTWLDGSTTDVTLRLTHDGGAVCAVIDPRSLPRPTDAGLLRMSGRLAATSADGRLDADWPVTIEVLGGENGAVSEVNVRLDHAGFGAIPGAQLAQVYGVPDLELTGFDGYQIAMDLGVMVASGVPTASFALHIRGLRNQPCDPPPPPDPRDGEGMGSPGCRGAEIVELEALSF